MKLISTEKVFLQNDRNGEHVEYVQIEVYYTPESDNKRWRFDVRDYAIIDKDEETETKMQLHEFGGAPVQRTYYKTYEEFKAEMDVLATNYPTELEGAYAIDFYVIKGSLYQLVVDPIYNATFSERIYPIIEEEVIEE